jgi:hypothetical protein
MQDATTSENHNSQIRCERCPSRTPLRPDPENLERAKRGIFEPPLDEGVRDIVLTLLANGVETFESCEGGDGHSFSEPTVLFEGSAAEGWRALSIAFENDLPVSELRRAWGVIDGVIHHGAWWVMTFHPPRFQSFKDRVETESGIRPQA